MIGKPRNADSGPRTLEANTGCVPWALRAPPLEHIPAGWCSPSVPLPLEACANLPPLMYFLPRPLLSDLSGSGPCLLKFYLFYMPRISPFNFSALWACLAVHFPPSASSIIFTHRNIYTCTYVCVCTCTCVCIHIRSEVYIKGAWEMLHNDGFRQLMYGPATSRKMVSFASSYWLPRCGGSFWGSNGQAAVSDSRIQGPWSSRDITPPVLNTSCDVGPFPWSSEDPIQLFPCDLDISRELSLST